MPGSMIRPNCSGVRVVTGTTGATADNVLSSSEAPTVRYESGSPRYISTQRNGRVANCCSPIAVRE
ncbi:hypothetical protein GCM10009624_35030 [Gordonia sinesedis]